MVALANFATNTGSVVTKVEGKRASLSVRTASMIFGFAFIWAGAGLWLMPGLDLTPTILLAKMGMSILLVTGGVGLTQVATDKPRQELHFDERNKQLVVYEGLPRGRKHAVQTIQYENVGRIDVSDRELQVTNGAGETLVALPIDGSNARLDTIAQLRSLSLMPG